MLGGDYDKDINKLKTNIENIRTEFNSLAEIMATDSSSSSMLEEVKSSTMTFLDNSLTMMLGFSEEAIHNKAASLYNRYKKDLTP